MTSPRLVVGGVIIDRSAAVPRVLAARRSGPLSLAGRWEFPGGKVESDESPEIALARELQEELSVRIAVDSEILPSRGDTWPISEHFVMRLFVCTIKSGGLKAGDSHDELRWLSPDEINQVRWLDSDTHALDSVERLLSGT